jgi:hypothetical protein
MAKHKSIIRPGPGAGVSCAVCGQPLHLWSATRALDGQTVCASDCLGAGILRARQLPEYQDDPPAAPEAEACGSWFDDVPE